MFRKLCKDKAAYEPVTGTNFSCVLCLRRSRLRKTTYLLAVSFLYRIDDMRVYCGLADQTGERITP